MGPSDMADGENGFLTLIRSLIIEQYELSFIELCGFPLRWKRNGEFDPGSE